MLALFTERMVNGLSSSLLIIVSFFLVDLASP